MVQSSKITFYMTSVNCHAPSFERGSDHLSKYSPFCHRVHIALEETHAKYTLVDINLKEKPAWFTEKVNTAGVVRCPIALYSCKRRCSLPFDNRSQHSPTALRAPRRTLPQAPLSSTSLSLSPNSSPTSSPRQSSSQRILLSVRRRGSSSPSSRAR